MAAPLSLRAYARRRRVSPEAVSRAVGAGRLSASVVLVGGQPKIADAELADREWDANTRQRSDVQTSGRQDVPPPGSSPLDLPPVAAEPLASAPRGARAALPEGVPAYHVSQAIRAQAAARREIAAADQAEIELAARRGKLVDVAELTGEFNAHITNAKARLLALPTRVGQELPDLAERVVPVVDRLIRAALQELAADGSRS